MRVNYETSVKVRRGSNLRFLNNMGSGLVVGLGSGSSPNKNGYMFRQCALTLYVDR